MLIMPSAQVDEVVQQVLQKHGRLDGVANCVGSVVARSALATELDQLEDTIKVCFNTTGCLNHADFHVVSCMQAIDNDDVLACLKMQSCQQV